MVPRYLQSARFFQSTVHRLNGSETILNLSSILVGDAVFVLLGDHPNLGSVDLLQ